MEAATATKPRPESTSIESEAMTEDELQAAQAEPGDEGQTTPPTPPAALPDDGEGDEDGEAGDQLFLVGDGELGLKVSGRKPDSAVLKFKGAKVDLHGQFNRGDRITAVDVWQVTADLDQDTIDTLSGEVKSTSKAQGATLCGTKRIESWLAERLIEAFSPDEVQSIFAALDLELPED